MYGDCKLSINTNYHVYITGVQIVRFIKKPNRRVRQSE